MKTNLKTLRLCGSLQDILDELDDFEAELREEQKKCLRYLHADGRLVKPQARYKLIGEILG